VEASPKWNLSPHIQQAIDLLEEMRAQNFKSPKDLLAHGGLFGDQQFSPKAVALAEHLQKTNATALTAAARQYAEAAKYAAEYQGPGLLGEFPEPLTPAQAFAESFDKAKAKPRGKAAKPTPEAPTPQLSDLAPRKSNGN
jgi:hypothetical protein